VRLSIARMTALVCRWSGCRAPNAATARVTDGCSAAIDHATIPPTPCPTTTASCAPSERMTPATSRVRVGMSYPLGGLSEAPVPRRSIATAR